MLAEIGLAISAIKACNEAVSAIREMAGNVESVGQMGSQLTKLADNREVIEKKAKDGDMDAFFALEDIRKKEKEIKELFVYAGRAGLWDDYQTFIRNRKQMKENERKRAEAKRLARRKAIKTGFTVGLASVAILTAVGGAAYMVYWMVSLRGR